MTITPVKLVYKVGELLTCSASANPPLAYITWHLADGDTLVPSSGNAHELQIPATWLLKTVTVRCEVGNKVLNSRFITRQTELSVTVSKYSKFAFYILIS